MGVAAEFGRLGVEGLLCAALMGVGVGMRRVER